MTPDTGPSSYFRKEYTRELETWLSQRLRLLCVTYIVLGAAFLLFSGSLGGIFGTDGDTAASVIFVVSQLATLAIVARFFFARKWQDAEREELLRGASRLIFILGVISLGAWIASRLLDPDFGGNPIWPLFYWHFTACLFLPWKPSESMRPFIPLVVVWAGAMIVLDLGSDRISGSVLTVALSPLVFLPGLLISGLRLRWHSRQFYWKMIGRHFDFMRQELRRARSIHESAFPEPFTTDNLAFQYTYLPTRDLGGDFLHAHVNVAGAFTLTVIDVTGHGLAAALTVNRLFGELERIHAEIPEATPAQVIRLLNRYIYLTLSHHMIYASALCVQVNPFEGTIRWCSAGHPPAILRREDGRTALLGSTTSLLGVLPDEEYAAEEETESVGPEDIILAYTDGVLESQNRTGEQLGLDALREMMSQRPAPRNWTQYIASRVEKHTAGRAEDDVLVVTIEFRGGIGEQPSAVEEHTVSSAP